MKDITPEIGAALGLLKSGKTVAAEECLLAYSRRAPTDPAGWYLLGAALHAQGRTASALARMERSLDLAPDQPEVLKATAMLCQELKRYRAGLLRAERACSLAPEDLYAWLAAGSLLETLKRGEEALLCYEMALARDPGWPPALLNRGALLMGLGRHRLARENFLSLVRLHPEQADAHFNLAEANLACGNFDEAAASSRQALQIDPGHVGACIDLALALCMLGKMAEAGNAMAVALSQDRHGAESHFRRALQAGGGEPGSMAAMRPEELFLWQHGERQKSCDWRNRKGLIDAMTAKAEEAMSGDSFPLSTPGTYFHSLALPLSGDRQLALARNAAAGILQRADDGQPVRTPARYHRMRGPLRIGYLSPDYRLHPVAYLHWRQMALHDRERFRVFAYSLHPDDGSEVGQRVRASCDEWRPCAEDPISLTAARIRYDGIEVLVDLSGYTRFTRPEILALRPAPIQVAYMGMPATSGAMFIDYRVTDAITTPRDHAGLWTERLAFLPGTLFMYNNGQEVAAPSTRREVGLPEEAFVFCCFNNAFKIEPDVFSVWMRLLQRIPDSVLWLLSDDENVRDNLRREAGARGVAADRLMFAPFLPFAEHLARYALADLFLDTFYCGAHTTAADALWGGLPVLTCLGSTMASRLAASIVAAAGLPELIVTSHEEYEALACRLASRPGELADIRRRLQDCRRQAPLFDTEGRVRELECAYEMMWERHAAGLPPESFTVPAASGASA